MQEAGIRPFVNSVEPRDAPQVLLDYHMDVPSSFIQASFPASTYHKLPWAPPSTKQQHDDEAFEDVASTAMSRLSLLGREAQKPSPFENENPEKAIKVAHRSSRLSSFLPYTSGGSGTGSLLGRPRTSPASTPKSVVPDNGGPFVLPPPPTLPSISSTNGLEDQIAALRRVSGSGGSTATTTPSRASADLAALSNLTITSDYDTSSIHHSMRLSNATSASLDNTNHNNTNHSTAAAVLDVVPRAGAGGGQRAMAACSNNKVDIISPGTTPKIGDHQQADWRTAFKVRSISPEGNCKVLDSHQNSSTGSESPPEHPATLKNNVAATSSSSKTTTSSTMHTPRSPFVGALRTEAQAAEFMAAAADPHCGFPNAENQIPGYLLGPVIGRGGFSVVRKGLHIPTSLPVAIKVVEKERVKDPKDRDRIDREMRVMRKLGGHVAIAQLLECAETPQCLYLVMEHCAGGSLLDYVRAERRLPEHEACALFQQLLAAVHHCHSQGVVHRDIKLENVLLDGRGVVRLIDFGLCGYYVPDKYLRCHCGSPSYAAPEIVARKEYSGPPVDVWSAGVVLFSMLAGYLPFHAKDKKALSQKIMDARWRAADWMSDEAVSLLEGMLALDPLERITIEEIWRHPWMVNGPRWEGRGEGSGGLMRAPVDLVTGGQVPDAAVVAEWATMAGLGSNVVPLLRALRYRECNALTAGYHLICESKAAERACVEGGCLGDEHESRGNGSRSASSSRGESDQSSCTAAIEMMI